MSTTESNPLISIRNVSKAFGDFTAVDNVDLDINSGELFVLLGGSGCGKTTLLRMLAGFETPTSGSISIDGVDMAGVEPYSRPVNMMFQSYALFPHMSVFANVAYGLKREGVARRERRERVKEMLNMVELGEFAKRKPDQLSGGQRQRVALARCLIKRPKVLLLDEPLGALDKRLREQTQFELMQLQDKLGTTFVVVTHDQEEAMTLASRIAVMDQGKFVQIGTPAEIYETPQSRFVASFIGSANMLEGKVTDISNGIATVQDDNNAFSCKVNSTAELSVGDTACVAIRPEKITVSADMKSDTAPTTEAGMNTFEGTVKELAYLGGTSVLRIETKAGTVANGATSDGRIFQVTSPNRLRSLSGTHDFDWNDKVRISFPASNAILLTR